MIVGIQPEVAFVMVWLGLMLDGVGLGLGLPGVKRLMDESEIASEAGRGATVSVKKWRKMNRRG